LSYSRPIIFSFLFQGSRHPRPLHSFPTRRSSDLQLVEGTRGLISLFSARQAPAPGKFPAALFPSELPQGADYDKFIGTVKSNERSEEHTSELQSRENLVCRLLLEKKKKKTNNK